MDMDCKSPGGWLQGSAESSPPVVDRPCPFSLCRALSMHLAPASLSNKFSFNSLLISTCPKLPSALTLPQGIC